MGPEINLERNEVVNECCTGEGFAPADTASGAEQCTWELTAGQLAYLLLGLGWEGRKVPCCWVGTVGSR